MRMGSLFQFLQDPARPGKRWNDNTRTAAHELILREAVSSTPVLALSATPPRGPARTV